MNRSTRVHRLVAAGIVAAASAAGSLAGVVHARHHGPEVPARLTVPTGNKAFLIAHAAGVQIYSCDGVNWSFVAPRANLYNDTGKLVATHYAGPTWEARDGSTVAAQRVDGATVDPNAIPWLLLSRVSSTVGPDGARLTKTTYIQRTATTGGLAPAADECTAMTAGTAAEVPYTADYTFWKSSGS